MLRNQFIFMEKNSFVFVYVPKVACTNWKALLRHLSGFPDYLDSSLAHDKRKNGLVYLSDVAEWKEILADPGIAKYSFVRNPYTRILSAYLNKFEPLTRGDGAWLGAHFRAVYQTIGEYRRSAGHCDTSVSFEAFLDWLAHSGHPYVDDEHWVPQSRILSQDTISYDFVGRFERLKTDAAILMHRMKCEVPFPTQESLDFPATNSTQRLAAYYADREVALARKIYAADFQSLGYSLELPLASPTTRIEC
jgi:hypothetical protein